MTTSGVDYAWGRPRPSVLAANGYVFACRYLSYDTSGKNLIRSEADALHAAGVATVSNWEWYADDALGRAADGSWISPYTAGVNNARAALSQHNACGGPSSAPIYFSVDFDATAGQQAAINSYLDGAASVLGRGRVGAYGGYYVISRCFDAGKITFGWQAYAWSGGQWDSRAQLRQVQNEITVDGVDCDRDTAMTTYFGQWGAGSPSPDLGGFLMALTDAQQTEMYHAIVTGGGPDISERRYQRLMNGRDGVTGTAGQYPGLTTLHADANAISAKLDPAKLADAVAAAIVAKLPAGTLTKADVQDAVTTALGHLHLAVS